MYTTQDRPLPNDSLLHRWIDDSVARVKARTSDCAKHLPATAAFFFRFYSTKRNTLARILQRTFNTQATPVAIQRENAATILAGHAIVDMHRRAYESSNEEGAR